MMTKDCPDIGAWRAWLDHERIEHVAMDAHLEGCPGCRRLIADLRDDANAVRDIFAVLAPTRLPSPAEVAVAGERLGWRRAPRPTRGRLGVARITTAWRLAASSLAAVLALAAMVAFTPEGGSAAAAFLAQFRSQQVSAVELTPASQAEIVKVLTALGNLGTIQGPGGASSTRPAAVARAAEGQVQAVSLAQAGQTVGFTLLTPDPATLPAGVSRTPRVHVSPGSQVRFTFDKKKAQAHLQSIGRPEVSLPDKFDGATLVVSMPAAALLEYGGDQSKSELIIGEAGELVVDVQGNVSLPELRDFLLGLPGLPADVVGQLKQIQNWNDTLPIPIPIDHVHWQSVSFNGNQGLLLNDNTGVGSAAIWQANGHLFGVAGSIKATDLQRVANSLAVR
jgi:hypothetical protein